MKCDQISISKGICHFEIVITGIKMIKATMQMSEKAGWLK